MFKTWTSGPDPNFQDGDLIHAFNSRSIKFLHAQNLTLPYNDPLDVNGLRTDGLGRHWLEATSLYRFERISRKFARKIKLSDLSEEIVGNISRTVNRKLLHPQHAVYGTPYREVWYQGHNHSDAAIDDAWARIEGNSLYREINYRWTPLGSRERFDHLVVPVADFTNLEREAMESPVFDRGDILKIRSNYSDYWNLAGIIGRSVTDIRDRSIEVDITNEVPRLSLVKVKP